MKLENMETWKRIKIEQDKKDINDKEFEIALGLKPKTINNWKRGMSSSYMNMLPEIADYFNVSVDYLLGRDEKSPTEARDKRISDLDETFTKNGISAETLNSLPDSQKNLLINIINEIRNK